jgi:hypothetical protein
MKKANKSGKVPKLSIPAQAIKTWLDTNDVIYKIEVRYRGCTYKKPLPLDFEVIVKGHVGVIEYDGEHHFKHIPRFHGEDPKGFEEQKEKDLIKTKFAYKESFSLLRISFLEESKIPEVLTAFIASMSKSGLTITFTNPGLYKEHIAAQSTSCAIM